MRLLIAAGMASVLVACETSGAISSPPSNPSALKPTPFTLALVGQADAPEGGNVPDVNNATDLAYCVHLLTRDAFQTRIGSDFSKNALEKRRKLQEQMTRLGVSEKQAEKLLSDAAEVEATAINKGRSGDMRAMMAFNFGGHKKSCYAAAERL